MARSPRIISAVTKRWSSRSKADLEWAAIWEKLKALLWIARQTARGGKNVTREDIARTRAQCVTDPEIHDTVLIAAVFCLCNRYVDGLATWTSDDPEFFSPRRWSRPTAIPASRR